MTWEPKNGLHDEDVDVSDEEEGDNSFSKDEKPNALGKLTWLMTPPPLNRRNAFKSSLQTLLSPG